MAARLDLRVLLLCGSLVACSSGKIEAVPEVGPFRSALPGAQLGVMLADLRDDRPGLGVTGDGTYWEEVWDLKVEYGFWPKEADRTPPLSARLMSIEVREEVYDTVRLRAMWLDAVDSASEVLGTAPGCSLLSGVRARLQRADFEGQVRISVTSEIWIADDGQDFGASLITRAYRTGYASPKDAGLQSQKSDC